jgi:hypothetical protein
MMTQSSGPDRQSKTRRGERSLIVFFVRLRSLLSIEMKITFAILATFSSLLFLPSSVAQEPSTEIWVAIDATMKGLGAEVVEYYGALDKKVFDETLTRTMPSGFLRLTHTSWMEAGELKRLAESSEGGTTRGYSDVMYFRIETVTRIVELDSGFVKKYMLQTK